MSLWSKPIAEIEFSDVEAYCSTPKKPAEGWTLDFKREINSGTLAKTLVAFANTDGGLVLIGIDSDNLNQPVWPPIGVDLTRGGLTEQLGQIARNAIMPPLDLEISRPLPLPTDANRAVLVVRIPPSIDAPHATDNGTAVYIRANDTNEKTKRANLDDLDHLFRRRRQIEQTRTAMIDQARKLANRLINPSDINRPATFWLSIIPAVPIKPILNVERCFGSLKDIGHARYHYQDIQRIAGGAIGSARAINEGPHRPVRHTTVLKSLGQMYFAHLVAEQSYAQVAKAVGSFASPSTSVNRFFEPAYTWTVLRDFRDFMAKTLATSASILPAYLHVAWGIEDARGMAFTRDSAAYLDLGMAVGYLEDDFSDEFIVPTSQLCEVAAWRPSLERFVHAFGWPGNATSIKTFLAANV